MASFVRRRRCTEAAEEARLSEGGLPAVPTGFPSPIGGPADLASCAPPDRADRRRARGGRPEVVFHAHEACYKPWLEESVTRRTAGVDGRAQ